VDFNEAKQVIEEFFNNKFEVKKFLGEGSFAKVYLVNHNYLDTLMAMKIIKEPLVLSTNKKDVFREVTLACQLRHENIISIYDAAEIYNFEDGNRHAYFVMEYVSGGDLERFLNSFIENGIFMPIERSLDLIRQILSGLSTLHCADPPIVHRDLKPNNVLLSFNASGDIIIKISDFGFAKEVTTSISDIDIAGTRPYMAPELFNKSVSTKSDIYAVGVMFYQLLTNHFPYRVEEYTTEELISLKPWLKELKPPSHYNSQVCDDLDSIVLKCLETDPSRRYRDANELLEDVEEIFEKYKEGAFSSLDSHHDNFEGDFDEYIINDSIKEAFRLAKCENGLGEAIEILENEILDDYDIRKCYSETLRIWKSKRPDVKLISKAFTVNLKGRNYKLSSIFLKEAIAYNPSIRNRYQHYIDLWEIFTDLERNGRLFKAVVGLENLMDTNSEIRKMYRNLLPTLKTYSVEEIVVEALRLVDLNRLSDGANLMEFAVVCDRKTKSRYAYKLSMWKQNMKMDFRHSCAVQTDTIDYAIDLGTTDSVISYFNNGNPIIIKNHRTGDEFTPSAVLIDENEDITVGMRAKNALLENDPNAVSEFKHDMGFPIPFKFEKSSRVMFPEELSAELLKDLRVSAYDERNINIEHAVICVPANSNPMKTRAINNAAELAGFQSHSLILEPIAVSIAYGLQNSDGYWMTYDLGGGTFNVSLIGDNNGEIEKIATEGLENLGGNTFDWKIVNDLFRPKIAYDLNLDDFGRDNPRYYKVFAKLKYLAEMAKKDLGENEKTDVSIANLFEGYDFTYTLTRDDFRKIIRPLMTYTFRLSRKLLSDCAMAEEDIDKIILVGGSCLSPVVQDLIREEFSVEIESVINPLTVVSKGAAIYAGNLEKPKTEMKRQDLSVLLSLDNGKIRGRAFTNDLKSSFLGYFMVFTDGFESIRIPLKIDGTFKLRYDGRPYDIRILEGENPVRLDIKSPNSICEDKIFIPFFSRQFALSCDSTLDDLKNHYSKLLKEIDYLNEFSSFNQSKIQKYIEALIELAGRDPSAVGHAEIYCSYLEGMVNDAKDDLEFSVLLQNVSNKIAVVRDNDLFEVENLDEIIENRDLERLKKVHADLIERYVVLNRDMVIEDCFNDLKFDGIFINNENLAGELIENAQIALYNGDYDELFNIVNLLFELDERLAKG
jgi:molecular chaperone DnaK (HSP70)/serine/threonine protein kinase